MVYGHFLIFLTWSLVLETVFHSFRSLRRYLTRRIGFEAVMRIRCTEGM